MDFGSIKIHVLLFNYGDEEYVVHRGDRVAQMIMEKMKRSEIVELNENENHDSTQRGVNGFGSSGI